MAFSRIVKSDSKPEHEDLSNINARKWVNLKAISRDLVRGIMSLESSLLVIDFVTHRWTRQASCSITFQTDSGLLLLLFVNLT